MTGKQTGSTLLGLVIGGLVGLGLAFAVALYITKVPVPLTAKAPQHSAESDAAEIQKNKNWDPNAPLAGKGSVKPNPVMSGEIASGVQPLPAASAPGPARLPELAAKKVAPKEVAPKVVVAAVPEPAIAPVAPALTPVPAKAAKPRPTEPTDDELGQFIAAVPAKPAKPAATPATAIPPLPATAAIPPIAAKTAAPLNTAIPPVASDPFTYFIQAGAFRTPEEAEKQRSRLQSLGMASRVTEREQAGRMVYRVRVGPFEKKDDADRMQGKMEGQSISTNLVRVQR